MISEESILDLRDRIAEEFRPERIVLFGSYAKGNADDYSDLDVLVILRHAGSGIRKAAEILLRVDPHIAIDLIVRSPEEIEARLKSNDFFLAEILNQGRVLYEAPDR